MELTGRLMRADEFYRLVVTDHEGIEPNGWEFCIGRMAPWDPYAAWWMVKVEPDYEAANILLSEILDAMGISASINAGMIVDAALGIGELDGWVDDE